MFDDIKIAYYYIKLVVKDLVSPGTDSKDYTKHIIQVIMAITLISILYFGYQAVSNGMEQLDILLHGDKKEQATIVYDSKPGEEDIKRDLEAVLKGENNGKDSVSASGAGTVGFNNVSPGTYSKKEAASISKEAASAISNGTADKLGSSLSDKESKDKLNSIHKDVTVTIPSTTHTGTDVYAINVKRAQHGVGLYVGYKNNDSSDGHKANMQYGVHYRNKRIVYQAGVDRRGKPDGRVAYEVVQW